MFDPGIYPGLTLVSPYDHRSWYPIFVGDDYGPHQPVLGTRTLCSTEMSSISSATPERQLSTWGPTGQRRAQGEVWGEVAVHVWYGVVWYGLVWYGMVCMHVDMILKEKNAYANAYCMSSYCGHTCTQQPSAARGLCMASQQQV